MVDLGACWVRQKPPGIISLMGNPVSSNESTSENFALQSQGSPEQLLERQTLVCAKGRKTQPECLTSCQPLCIRACIYACMDTWTNLSKKALENDACKGNRNTFLSFVPLPLCGPSWRSPYLGKHCRLFLSSQKELIHISALKGSYTFLKGNYPVPQTCRFRRITKATRDEHYTVAHAELV